MNRLLSRAAASLLAAVLSIATCELAAAATKQPSIIVESTPAPKATVTASQMVIDIHFAAKIDRRHSRLALVLPNGRLLDLVSLASAADDHLSARASNLTPGNYVLRWQALPVGKKVVRGEIPFTVK
jgi:methionine-rich copper-binding protein CopC